MIKISALTNPKLGNAVECDLPHVLLVVDQFPKALGGGERILLKLAKLLPKYGYRVSIMTFFVHPDCDVIAKVHCPVYVLPLQCTYDLNALRAALEFRRFIRSQRVSIVQTFFESSDIWAGFVTKMTSNAKLIWSRRDMGILRTRKHRIAYRRMAKLPDAVFSVSSLVSKYCTEVDGIDPARVHTIYNGLDLANGSEDRLLKAPGKVRVVTVGNIRRIKGHDLFIRSASLILERFPEVSFSIAGEVLEADYFEELKALIRKLNISDHFHFSGSVADTSKYLSDADIFVLPSRSEGFSNAIIEAMAATLPVIATDVGGNAEAVIDGVTGIVIPPEDAAALATAIVRLLSDPQLATAMGLAGRSRVAKEFTTEAMMEKVVAVYKNLLG